jgi:hypothetical protein
MHVLLGARAMIPTSYKDRLPKDLSWPVNAQVLSEALEGVPQYDMLTVSFSMWSTFRKSEFTTATREKTVGRRGIWARKGFVGRVGRSRYIQFQGIRRQLSGKQFSVPVWQTFANGWEVTNHHHGMMVGRALVWDLTLPRRQLWRKYPRTDRRTMHESRC